MLTRKVGGALVSNTSIRPATCSWFLHYSAKIINGRLRTLTVKKHSIILIANKPLRRPNILHPMFQNRGAPGFWYDHLEGAYISRLRIRSSACWVANSLTRSRSPLNFFSMDSVLWPSLRAM